MEDAAAAGFWIPNMTAWTGLVDRGHLQAGQRLVVLGAAGGSGIAAVQLGKALGAEVVAVAGDESRAEFCRSYGADHALVCRKDTVADGRPLAQALREITDWQGADMIFDPVGGAQGTSAMGALAREGKHLAIGFASGTWPTVDVQMMTLTNTSLVGVLAAGHSQDHIDAILQGLTTMMSSGKLRGTVLEKVPFDGVPDALTRIAARTTRGKCVVEIDE
jgi:NADPH:quinone reductase